MFVMLILLIIPCVRPIGIPIPVSEYTQEVYDYIENLPDESMIVVSCNVGVALWPEEETFVKALFHQLFTGPHNFVIVSFGIDSPTLLSGALVDLNPEVNYPNKKYGEDYVLMGYLAGLETAMARFCDDPDGAYEEDYYGNSVSELGIFSELQSASDIDLQIDITGSDPDAPVRQFVETYGIPLAMAPTIGWVPTTMPYYNAGQLVGLIAGVRGGAEYELLVGRPSTGLAITDALSLGFMYTILLSILGNISQFVKKTENKTEVR
jgi:hypothetical protein